MSEIKIFPENKSVQYEIIKKNQHLVQLRLNAVDYEFELVKQDGATLLLKTKSGELINVSYGLLENSQLMVVAKGREAFFAVDKKRSRAHQEVAGGLMAPMPGKIFKLLKNEKDQVKAGDTILILEAMKMEHSIKADKAGVIKKIHYKVGDQVQGQAVLAEIE